MTGCLICPDLCSRYRNSANLMCDMLNEVILKQVCLKYFPFLYFFFFPGITCHSACGHWSLSFSLPCSDGGSCLGSSAYWVAHCQVNSMYYLCFQLLAHALDLSLDVILAFQACELLLLQVVFDELCPECWNFDNWRKFLLKKKKKSAKP